MKSLLHSSSRSKQSSYRTLVHQHDCRLAPVEQRVVAVYVGFSKTTSPVIRGQWLEYFSTVNFAASQKKPMERRFLFKRIGQFAFVASPPGNGFDCHRTWEALILGCIVIVQNSSVRLDLACPRACVCSHVSTLNCSCLLRGWDALSPDLRHQRWDDQRGQLCERRHPPQSHPCGSFCFSRWLRCRR